MAAAHLTLRRMTLVLSGLLGSGIVVFVLGISLGPSDAGLGSAWSWLTHTISTEGIGTAFSKFLDGGIDDVNANIVWRLRVPLVLLAGVVGASLAAAGTGLQAILRNPLADPFILGISGGAALGAALGIVLDVDTIHPIVTPLFSFGGAMGAMGAVHFLAGGAGARPEHLLLVGFVTNLFCGAAILFVIHLAEPEKMISINYWLMGQITEQRATPGAVMAVAVAGVGALAALIWAARDLNLMSAGTRTAKSLGVDVPKSRMVVYIAASLATGAAVSLTGLIGFVGIIVPHVLRMVVGPDHRLLVPASFLGGGTFLVLALVVSRTVFSGGAGEVLPVGAVTALIGSPVFVILLRKRSFPGAGS